MTPPIPAHAESNHSASMLRAVTAGHETDHAHAASLCKLPCRYKLGTPSTAYTDLHQQLRQRLELCHASVKLMKDNSSLTPVAAAQNAFDTAHAEESSDDEQKVVTAFVEAHLSAWMEVYNCQSSEPLWSEYSVESSASTQILLQQNFGLAALENCAKFKHETVDWPTSHELPQAFVNGINEMTQNSTWSPFPTAYTCWTPAVWCLLSTAPPATATCLCGSGRAQVTTDTCIHAGSSTSKSMSGKR